MDRSNPRRRSLLLAAPVGGLVTAVLGLALAAAAGATTPTTGAVGTATQGAVGTVAALVGTSMEVQNQQTGQVTVDWTTTTTFTQEATVSAASLAAGDCVTAIGTQSKGRISAQTVSISPPSSGSCTGPGPASSSSSPGGSGTSGAGGTGPVTITGGSPVSAGAAPPQGGQVLRGTGPPGVASGKVLSVSASRLVLSGFSSTAQKVTGRKTNKKGRTRTTSRSAKRPGSSKPQVVSVTLSRGTTYRETQPAAASDLAVGDCVAANGPASANGSVTAKDVQITATGGKNCTGSGIRLSGGNTAGGSPAGGGVSSQQVTGG